MTIFNDFDRLEVIAPNFKSRLSGVTSTIIQLVPEQTRQGLTIATLGLGLPDSLPRLRIRDLWRLWKRPSSGEIRVFHARRNTEMVGGLLLRDLLRMPLKLVFTSASQRSHKRFTKWLINRMDDVIATSAKTAAYLERKCHVIHHGIDLQRFVPAADKRLAKSEVGLPPDKHVVGCFGRIRHQKGTDLFLDAVIPLLKDHPDWLAIIAGRATEQHLLFVNDLKGRIAKAGLGDRILFVGEHRDIERWYRALDLFVAPQRWEGFGLTPLEAMASGVPVVATDVGAFSELIVSDETGHVLDDLQSDTMRGAIEKYFANPHLCERHGTAARQHMVSNFSLEREAAKLITVYRAV
ncbi:MAG: glycosyltransferase family 4 protein [Pirellulaceae bacterium]